MPQSHREEKNSANVIGWYDIQMKELLAWTRHCAMGEGAEVPSQRGPACRRSARLAQGPAQSAVPPSLIESYPV